jgi:hypothetical protein
METIDAFDLTRALRPDVRNLGDKIVKSIPRGATSLFAGAVAVPRERTRTSTHGACGRAFDATSLSARTRPAFVTPQEGPACTVAAARPPGRARSGCIGR